LYPWWASNLPLQPPSWVYYWVLIFLILVTLGLAIIQLLGGGLSLHYRRYKTATSNTQLRKARLERGWSQSDLAVKVGVDIHSIQMWESGMSHPNYSYRKRLGELFDKSEEEPGFLEQEHDVTGTFQGISFAEVGARGTISRRKVILSMLGTMGGLIAGSAGLSWFLSRTAAQPTSSLMQPTLVHVLLHTDIVSSIAWSPDGKQLVSGSFDFTSKVWDVATGSLMLTYRGHSDVVTSVAWSPLGDHIASGSWDRTVRVWDTTTETNIAIYYVPRAANSVAWSYNSRYLAAGCSGSISSQRVVEVWDSEKQELILTYQNDTKNIHTVAWSPKKSTLIASGTDKNSVYIQDFSRNETILTYFGHSDQVNTVAWSPKTSEEPYIASGSGNYDLGASNLISVESSVHVWSALTGKTHVVYRGHQKSVLSVAWSPDGRYIASGSADTTVHVWEALTGRLLSLYKGHTSDVESVAWSPDGRYIASGSADRAVHIWKLPS